MTRFNGQLLRPLVVIGAAAVAALFIVGLYEIAQHWFTFEGSANRFVKLVLLLAGIVGGGSAGAAYFNKQGSA